MVTSDLFSRHAHRVLQHGVPLFLFGPLAGFIVPALAVPRLGLSAHLLAVTDGTTSLGPCMAARSALS